MLSVMKDPGKVPKGRGENESLILLVALCRFAEAVAMGMLVPILPIYLSKLGDGQFREFTRWIESKFPAVVNSMPFLLAPSAEARTALLFFLAGLAMAIAQIFAGRLSDRLDRRKIFIVVGMFGGAICSFLFVRTENYSELLITRILQTMFLGLTFPPMMAIVARYSDPGRGGRLLGMHSTIRLFGFALGPLVGGFVTQFGGHHTTFYTSALLLVISVGLVLWLVPDPREGPVSPRSPRSRPPVPLMFRLLGASTFLMMVGISAFISLFPSYQREWGAKEWELGLCFGSFIVTRCLFQYASGWLGDHSDRNGSWSSLWHSSVPLILLQGVCHLTVAGDRAPRGFGNRLRRTQYLDRRNQRRTQSSGKSSAGDGDQYDVLQPRSGGGPAVDRVHRESAARLWNPRRRGILVDLRHLGSRPGGPRIRATKWRG